jgi:hypothetical protein
MQQQQMGQTQQPLMMEPPAVITTKDLLYLKDHLSWQLNAMKKCAHYAQECQDPQVRQALDEAGKMHQRHYQMLLKYCQYNNTQAMASVPQPQQQAQQTQQGMQ